MPPAQPREPDDASTATSPVESDREVDVAGETLGAAPLRLLADGLLREPCRIDLTPATDAGAANAGASSSPLDVALRVAAAEPLFDALERWLEVSLDVAPLDATGEPASGTAPEVADGSGDGTAGGARVDPAPPRLRLTARDADGPALDVHLPRRALASLPPLPESVAESIDIRLFPLPAICRVARLALSDEELEGLTPGAVLLLPETFGESWPVQLLARGVSADARLDVDEASVTLASGRLERVARARGGAGDARLDEDAGRDVDVVLAGRLAWDPLAVLGGAGESRLALPAALSQCRFHCLVGGRARLAGHVSPIGDGHGFFALERIGAPVSAPADASTDASEAAPTDAVPAAAPAERSANASGTTPAAGEG